jgi:Fic family protein
LQDTRDKGEWEGWLKFFLRGVSEVAQEATRTASTILQVREDTHKLISDRLTRASAGNAMALLSKLFYQPIVSVQQASQIIDMTYATANYLVSDLERIGVLKEITGAGRNRKYAFDPYLELFADERVETEPSVGARQSLAGETAT